MSALLRVRGIGKKGFWCLVNGLTNMDLGNRCNEDWRKTLVMVKQNWKITGATPCCCPTSWDDGAKPAPSARPAAKPDQFVAETITEK